MELYKARNFSAMFQDTFAFLKQNGKHFFKYFFIVNGIFVLIMLVLGYFFMKFYSQILFGGLLQNNTNAVDDFMNQNGGLFLLLSIIFIAIALLASVIQYAFIPIYLKIYRQKKGVDFGTKEIVNLYKENVSKIFIYLLCAIAIGIPLMVVLGVFSFVLMITIIGLLLIPVLIGAFSLFYGMTLMEYIEGKRGIWDSFGYSWTLLTSKFWAAVGNVGLFYLIAYVMQYIVTILAYVVGMINMVSGFDNGNVDAQEVSAIMTVVMLVSFVLAFLIGVIFNTIVLLNQGIVYYSLKEAKENINTKSIIDQIGSGE